MAKTCTCSAYKFPHRWLSGKCDGWSTVEKVFQLEVGNDCQSCQFYKSWTEPHGERMAECEVIEKGKDYLYCPCIDKVVS